jgi:hypothetical protein
MHSPEITRLRRRTWQEIASYYQSGVQESGLENWAKLQEFAHAMERKPYASGLVSVGSLGCILVFKDAECVPEKGYFLITCSPTDRTSDIGLGFFIAAEHSSRDLRRFGDVESAVEQFETQLEEHCFISNRRE